MNRIVSLHGPRSEHVLQIIHMTQNFTKFNQSSSIKNRGTRFFYLNEQFNFKKKIETLVCEKYVDLSSDSRHKSVSKTTLFPFLIAYIQLLATIVEAITTIRSHLSEKRDNEKAIRASFSAYRFLESHHLKDLRTVF